MLREPLLLRSWSILFFFSELPCCQLAVKHHASSTTLQGEKFESSTLSVCVRTEWKIYASVERLSIAGMSYKNKSKIITTDNQS